jgi:hypothetical protein
MNLLPTDCVASNHFSHFSVSWKIFSSAVLLFPLAVSITSLQKTLFILAPITTSLAIVKNANANRFRTASIKLLCTSGSGRPNLIRASLRGSAIDQISTEQPCEAEVPI